MTTTLRTTSDNKDFIELVKQLDAFLAEMDGAEHASLCARIPFQDLLFL